MPTSKRPSAKALKKASPPKKSAVKKSAPPAKKTSKSVAKPIAPKLEAPAPVEAAPPAKPQPPVQPPVQPIVQPPVQPIVQPPVQPIVQPVVESVSEPLGGPALPARLVELFRLSAIEQRVVLHLLTSSEPVSVSSLAERLELDVASTIALLGPDRALRARALVETEVKGLSWLLPRDQLTAARGLHLWCNEKEKLAVDDATLFAGHAPGISYFASPPPGTAWAQELLGEKRPAAVADVVREHLATGQAVALWLGGVSTNDVMPLVQALRARLFRPVVLVDGAQLGGWSQLELYATLLRLRRDADLRGAAVVVSDAKHLQAAYRALCQPRPAAQTAPVVLCQSDATPPVGKLPQGVAGDTPLVLAVASLNRPPAPVAPTANAVTEEEKEDPAVLASREDARRRAALDAARAMGRPIPPELNEPPKAAAPPPAPVLASGPAPTPAKAAASPMYRPPAPAQPPPAAPPVPLPPEEREEMPPGARAVNPRLAAALAKAGLPAAGSTNYQSEQYRRPSAPTPAAAPAAPPPPPAAAPTPAAAEQPAATAATTAAAPEAAAEVEEGPPIALEEGAPLEEIVRVARTTPNNAQRVKILKELLGKRAPSVIGLFRGSLTSANAAVRTAAEAGMASIFGANWNRTRAIAPPVQPPRSDDGGRGPGGAF